jgi:hypothetical protein
MPLFKQLVNYHPPPHIPIYISLFPEYELQNDFVALLKKTEITVLKSAKVFEK